MTKTVNELISEHRLRIIEKLIGMGIDCSVLFEKEFSPNQLDELHQAAVWGLGVERFADPKLSPMDMHRKIKKALKHKLKSENIPYPDWLDREPDYVYDRLYKT
jgi:hypothetical protein